MNEQCRKAIHEYYTLKHDYDEDVKSKKQSIIKNETTYPTKQSKQQAMKSIKIPCLYCKRPVGSLFTNKNKTLKLVCGNVNEPCPLHFEIYKGEVSHLEENFQIWLNEYINDLKENILKTKLDVLFQYISEESAVKQFQEFKEELDLYQLGYNTDYQMYLDKTNNPQIKKDLQSSIFKLADIKLEMSQQLELYRKTNDIRPFKDIATIYINKVLPLLDSIRELKYKYIQMEYDSDEETSTLVTKKVNVKDLETNVNTEDEPKIIANKK